MSASPAAKSVTLVMIKAPFADLATFYQGEQRVGSWPTLAGRGALC
jgi:hypothetical protein